MGSPNHCIFGGIVISTDSATKSQAADGFENKAQFDANVAEVAGQEYVTGAYMDLTICNFKLPPKDRWTVKVPLSLIRQLKAGSILMKNTNVLSFCRNTQTIGNIPINDSIYSKRKCESFAGN